MANAQTEVWTPKHNPWVVCIPVMLAAFMFVLDETIANVALPYMAGSFSVSRQESTWVLTSYLIASGIVSTTVPLITKLSPEMLIVTRAFAIGEEMNPATITNTAKTPNLIELLIKPLLNPIKKPINKLNNKTIDKTKVTIVPIAILYPLFSYALNIKL